eukprot:TRINITY_DN799_c0_g1_i2.p1 TRINITY_DN799_c0_g1~~TRINITY_DN799_c0_g1_i2.p1  ORF type:complete len:330 (+),score=68.04 TRINITY_DN799_c0_g1_i2:1263-2252(+)
MSLLERHLIQQIKKFIPPISFSVHKGESGKIGIVGGCREYTGAPYYSAISALKVGYDLSHVFCAEGAGVAIKSYSPELIVHPVMIEKKWDSPAHLPSASDISQDITKWFQALHVLVIGPGLGRDKIMWDTVKIVIEKAKEKELPLVIDGDGINLVCENPDLIKGYKLGVLTPNVVEFKRLREAFLKTKEDMSNDPIEQEREIQTLAQEIGNVTIVMKSSSDIIANGIVIPVKCNTKGSPRRHGGQGDVLAGTLGTFLGWAHQWSAKNPEALKELSVSPFMLASYAACCLVRHSGWLSFQKHKRASTTPNVIEELGTAFEKIFESDEFLE